MSVLHGPLDRYLEHLTGPDTGLLAEVDAYTFSRFESGAHMLSGRYQGRLLAWVSKLVQPKRILEIGTFTGYSALCLAEGLAEGGELHTIDRDVRLQEDVEGFFARSPFGEQMHLHIGLAAEVIPTLPAPFDLVFIDADKRAYGNYLEAVLPLCRKGATILIDNVLWKGRLYDAYHEVDPIGAYLADFNVQLAADPRVEALMLPVRDGLWAVRVK
jgi:predicted O-methyltransferase YrrM